VTTEASPHPFHALDITIAVSVAILAQLGFVAAFSLPSPDPVQADISNDNSQPIAVAITPVLKLGTKTPTRLPPRWQRRKPVAARTEPAALPSPLAEKTPEAIPKTRVADASAAPIDRDAGAAEQPNPTAAAIDAGAVSTASSTLGSEQGAANGTEADPLKARAADMYRASLASWFAAHFQIRGKVPYDKLKRLRAAAMVTVTGDRKMGSFTLVRPSGDPTFDAEVRATLSRIQSSGAELPAPPPMYPDMLGQSLPVGFQCTLQKFCE
jgi:hypothetical protein